MGATVLTSSAYDVVDLSQQFMSHAESTLSFHGLSLAPDGKAAMSQDFTLGASEMISTNSLTPDKIGLAHHGVAVYTQGVILQARYAKAQVVQANIIQRAKSLFCPGLWPFC